MAKFPFLFTGQQGVTAASVALPSFAQGIGEADPLTTNPVPGGGIQVILEALKANGASIFYGPAGVTVATGKELAPGQQDVLIVDNLNLIFVIEAVAGDKVSFVCTVPNP